MLAIRRAQRGSQAQGWRVRTVAGIRPANPFLAWIHGSVPEVQPRPCGMVSDRFGEHPCAGEGQLGVPLPGVASRTGQPRISSGRRVALCAGLSAGSSALHRPAVACRCALPRNRSREDRKTSLQPTRSPGRAPVSAGRTARTRPGGSRCAPGAHARRSVHVQLLPLCVLVCSGTRRGRRGHLMVRSLLSEANLVLIMRCRKFLVICRTEVENWPPIIDIAAIRLTRHTASSILGRMLFPLMGDRNGGDIQGGWAGGLGGGIRSAADQRTRGRRVAVRVLRAGVDRGLAGPGNVAGQAARAGGGAGPRARAYRR